MRLLTVDEVQSSQCEQVYQDVLLTLGRSHPLAGMCSPPLMGSSGVCPLVMVSTIPDICRHMSNLIVKAQHEAIIATNFWKYSEGTRLICNAIRELSKRCVADNRKVVVKVIYDRGDPKQIIDHHQSVKPKTFADPKGAVRLPHPDEIPGVDLEVVNYHRPPLGTFHAKFMIIDRKIALTQSNNIQDNENLEMMAQFEGPIVDSLYDMALITWHNPLSPPLPCGKTPAASSPPPTFNDIHKALFDSDGKLLQQYSYNYPMPEGTENVGDIAQKATSLTRSELPLHTSEDPHYDDDISKEVLRSAAGFIPVSGKPRMGGISDLLNTLPDHAQATAPEVEPSQMMTPMVPIPSHDPFPMAMVCREPFAPPTTSSVHTPQNAAFNSALRNAEKSVFIQTPNLNAAALLPEIIAACRRGINVTYYYCLGYNDAGELLPGQGGHNESIANKLYTELQPEFHKNLDIFCYVAKDQNYPIHKKFQKRACHIKLMIVDDHIAIQGSGNQDTQSWYHSQEVNVMLDSAFVCQKWMDAIRQNQNTHIYGQVAKEGDDAGCWLDPSTGKQTEGAIGVSAGRFSWAKGVQGAIARVRGTGGF